MSLTDAERVRLVNEVWPGDMDVAFSYLRSQPGVRKVYGVGGASCGVNQSIHLSRRHPEVKSLVLLSGGTNENGVSLDLLISGRPRRRLAEKSENQV